MFYMGGEGGWYENANRVFGKTLDEARSPVEVWAANIWNNFFLKSLRNGTNVCEKNLKSCTCMKCGLLFRMMYICLLLLYISHCTGHGY